MFSKVNFRIFLPPLILLTISVIVSLVDASLLVSLLDSARVWILSHFDWLFNWTVFGYLLLSIVIYWSPVGHLKIGNKDTVPIFSKGRWLAIVICTTIATGILFWGCAEPLFHLHTPPSPDIQPFTERGGVIAMSSIYMHWTFSPYALYCLVSLLFALAFYRYKLPFRVSSMIRIGQTDLGEKWYYDLIDGICLFALVAGMAASLGAGVLTISGGIDKLLAVIQGPVLWGFITLLIVAAFVASAASGLKRGIKWLSLINIVLFIIMILVFGIFKIDESALSFAGQGLVDYVWNFIPRSLGLSGFDRSWEQSWTSFYWANWMAWAPVTALFLGRIGRGYTVREFIRFNMFYPSLFSILWMTIFGGIAISEDFQTQGQLNELLMDGGPQVVIFQLIDELPLGTLSTFIFLFIAYVSYVTAADSNTSAMSGLSALGISFKQPDAPLIMKVIWGSLIAIMSWVMISYAGIEGIKILSILGGFPVLFLCIAFIFMFLRILRMESIKSKK